MQKTLFEVFKFGLSGSLVYFADLITYILLVKIGALYIVANVVAKVIGAGVGFYLHRNYTFKNEGGTKVVSVQLINYCLLLVMNILIASGLLYLMVNALSFDKYISKIIVDIIVISLSFTVSKFWVFK